ncbi:MAG: hypothetical protein J0H79_13895 [Alphaproteobacteria bacterium]|nr:hypothetical protein [Alphaproteobacteria bacterium]OJU56646.1 MAG: hypothetical protein BGO00_02510 [Alphaproteobacteria bacterium 62-8]
MHTFRLLRDAEAHGSTRGTLRGFNDALIASTLEDGFNAPKIAGRTRIPAGTYRLGFHGSPRFDKSYKPRIERAGERYRGMIHIMAVPGFEWILIHCGNTTADTAGCVLLGDQIAMADGRFMIPGGHTWPAFLRAYPILAEAIVKHGAELVIEDPHEGELS